MHIDHSLKQQNGSMLLESLIGIAIFSFGILSIIALQTNAMRSVAESGSRTSTAQLMQRIEGLMRVNATNLAGIAFTSSTCDATDARVTAWAADAKRLLPGASCTIAIGAEGALMPCFRRATITITWAARGSGAGATDLADLNRARNEFDIQTDRRSTTAKATNSACS